MTSKRIAQNNQQQKSDKSQGSGILQRAAVRSVSDAGVQSTDDQEELTLSNGAFSKDFSQVPISTNQPQQFQATKPQNYRVPPIQAKLTIGEPDDRYEQEADRVASQVVQRINAPSSTGVSVQREAMPEDEEELQMKSLADSIQRVEIDDEEELQMKTQVQRQEAIGGGEASTDLTSAINSARGGGQAIADNIREPMEVAFGADFSGVKVHTDGQSDQLNRSIQARAFTTGQDVFFRQGEYNPGSRGGQELLAHELTHVVQQSDNKTELQRRALTDGFNLNSVDFSDVSGHGTYATRQVTMHSQIDNLFEQIQEHLEKSDDDRDIVILTGCHGDPQGNLIYNHDNFYAEDLELEDEQVHVINMQNLTIDQQRTQMRRTNVVLILSWCYSAETYRNIDHYEIVG
ncbi:MAG: DUF4157 domain-containing protein [Nostoc sp. DedQUE04]|uniref:eCIS core domain-containing protein n=1 Tax=Nostoc sp. DedQUE04 TaxID=3075390 RepID=UPI002AD50E63|nr:DUF4157 domain-containing protein [Nostoc sp. DedQUE04]MDZ8140714.1 DUF4157 domain-containing protein [Nostoc sp. DedQUE04]